MPSFSVYMLEAMILNGYRPTKHELAYMINMQHPSPLISILASEVILGNIKLRPGRPPNSDASWKIASYVHELIGTGYGPEEAKQKAAEKYHKSKSTVEKHYLNSVKIDDVFIGPMPKVDDTFRQEIRKAIRKHKQHWLRSHDIEEKIKKWDRFSEIGPRFLDHDPEAIQEVLDYVKNDS